MLTNKKVYSIVSLVFERTQYARVAQLVERDLAKVEAAGSSPVSRFFYFTIWKTDAVLWIGIGFLYGVRLKTWKKTINVI